DVDSAVVGIVNATCRGAGHHQSMMICVSIGWFASGCVPTCDLFPRLAAVSGAVQIYAAADDMIGIRRMYDDGVAIGDLSLVAKMRPVNALPAVTAVCTPEHAEQEIAVAAGFIRGECVEHVRIGS